MTVPSTEDFTIGTWSIYDLALSEIGVDEARNKAYIRIGNNINEFCFCNGSGGTGTDIFVTGGTYNSTTGVATFTNNVGGVFTVSGFLTGSTGSGDTYWTSGSTGNFSLKAINTSGLDATGDFSVAMNFETFASGENSVAMNYQTIATGISSLAAGRAFLRNSKILIHF